MGTILFTFLIGLSILLWLERLTRHKLFGWFVLPFALALGLTVVAAQLWVTALTLPQWPQLLFTVGNGLFVLGTGYGCRNRVYEIARGGVATLRHMNILLIFLILFSLSFSGLFWQTHWGHAYIQSDAITVWFFKARIFFEDLTIQPASLLHESFISTSANQPSFSVIRPKYPILVPLNLAWSYLLKGAVEVEHAKLYWLILYLALVWLLLGMSVYICTSQLKKKQIDLKSQPLILLLPLLYITLPTSWAHFSVHQFGFADLWLIYFLTAAWICTYIWYQKHQTLYLILAGCFSAAAMQTKMEGVIALWLMPLLIVVPSFRQYIRWKIAAISLAVVLPLTWIFFVQSFGDTQTYEDIAFGQLTQVFQTFSLFIQAIPPMLFGLTNLRTHLLLWPLFFISWIWMMVSRKGGHGIWWLQSIVLVFFGLIALNYATYPLDLTMEHRVAISIDRYAANLSPIALMGIMIHGWYLFGKSRGKKRP